jgi:cytochrome P450
LERRINAKMEFEGQNFEFISFWFGRRLCLGMAFDIAITIHLEVAKLLHAFEWSFPNGIMTLEKPNMSEGQGLVMLVWTSLLLVAKPQLPSYLYQ